MKQADSTLSLVVERQAPATLVIKLSGNASEGNNPLSIGIVRDAFDQAAEVRLLSFESIGVTAWDSRFVAFIRKCSELCRKRNVEFRDDGLPQGVRRLLRLAQAVPERTDARPQAVKAHLLQKLGESVIQGMQGATELFTFLGENLAALANLIRGRTQFRWSDAFLVIQECGPQALGIVALINFLVGLILAFVGATELTRFGASIYVADLVGIATVREMGCLMTGIILCGRTGAAFAAQLGTMKVNEEIGALETFGISPVEFLVLPRMVALILVMPFLCAFADLISIAGGFIVSVCMLDVSTTEYLTRTAQAIQLKSFLLGIGKGSFFGFLVAYSGCLRGIQSGYSAADVGRATTKAVVTGITAIVASDGLFAVLCHALGI
ncbi:MAG TPA: ABC transporter permease [Verrucomicrobiae bacterium]|nr:ABC transporter permease [Verrucomicrobiae bacterium]